MVLIAVLYLSNVNNQAYALTAVKLTPSFTQQDIKETILKSIEVIEQGYIYPEKAELIAKQLRYKLASKGFEQYGEIDSFISELGVAIRTASGDSYLNVMKNSPYIENIKSENHKSVENYGFEKTEILSGNIGYLKLNYFYQHPDAELQAAYALNLLSATDAIIIDLRDVEGDSISLAQYMMSYFVEDNTILSEVKYDRQKKTNTLRSIALPPKSVKASHFRHNFPIYILTSAFVSGTGEFFSYTLKHLDRAVIVGEQTMGVALISKPMKINQFISIDMPVAIPIHPVSNGNWEQNGVVPDFNVKADHSLELAYQLAKSYLLAF